MRKSWLMCALLGAVAWGQAAPSAPTPAMPGKIPASAMAGPPAQAPDTAASVAPNAPVITVIGVCAPKPKPADAKGTGATPATAAKTPAAKTPAGKTPAEDCKTVITKAEFETLANNLAPNITPQQKKQLAGLLPRWIAMSDEATKKHLDRTPQFKDRLKVNRMQILSQMLQQDVQKEAAEVPEEEIDKYYKEHADSFEQFNVDRMFVPRTKQPAAESKEDQEKDKNLSEDAKKAKEAEDKTKAEEAEQAMTKLAESLRERAAAGEDFVKLQKEAFEAAGMKIESPTVNLPTVRRGGLNAGHAAVFDLKPGEVSQVINDAGGHYIYKLNSKSEVPLDQAEKEIKSKLQGDRTRELTEKLNGSFKVETNDAYFGPGGVGPAGPPRRPGGMDMAPPRGPRSMQGPSAGQPQAPPPAQVPAPQAPAPQAPVPQTPTPQPN
jgi:hypothetical protein